jgi:hypothetical protein
MEGFIRPLEQALLSLFKGVPSLPQGAQKTLVKVWPVLALVFGIVQLWAAYALWNLGHTANTFVDYANQLSIAAGNGAVTPTLGFFYYLGLAVLALDAVILLLAVSPLNGHKKSGWNFLFLGATLNLVYGLVILFDSAYGGFGNLLSSLFGSAVAFYLLYQVRDYYTGAKSVTSSAKPASPPADTSSKPKS